VPVALPVGATLRVCVGGAVLVAVDSSVGGAVSVGVGRDVGVSDMVGGGPIVSVLGGGAEAVAVAPSVGVGVGQPLNADVTARINSLMTIIPSPFTSPATHRLTSLPSSAMFTIVTSSAMVTVPSPSQSPTQTPAAGSAVTARSAIAFADTRTRRPMSRTKSTGMRGTVPRARGIVEVWRDDLLLAESDQLGVVAPSNTIGPCGFGTPPAASTVTAAALIAPASAGTGASTLPMPPSSGRNVPAATGPCFSVIHHSS
jgi:hypothetical protein